MIPKPLNRTAALACGVVVLFLAGASNSLADCPGGKLPGENQLHMLVLGDSIMWGQGLRREEKFWWRVKCWLEEKTGRAVNERIEAHSGALIDASLAKPIQFQSSDGEVNLDLPSIHQQLDRALEHYGPTGDKVDLVLVDGCINDIGVRTLLNPATAPDSLRGLVEKRCGDAMTNLLRRIVDKFPRANVLVTGYYRIVSTQTADNTFIRMLVKRINHDLPDLKRMDDREIRKRLITLSELWYKMSTAALSEAVNKVNAELAGKGLPSRIRFVEVQFWPEHSFSAADTLLWNFIFGSTNLSGFRNLLVILSLGSDAYKPNDRVRGSRDRSCKQTYKAPKGVKETKQQKKFRKESLLICRYASLGHPNQMGALIYTEALKGHLQTVIDTAGWKLSSTP